MSAPLSPEGDDVLPAMPSIGRRAARGAAVTFVGQAARMVLQVAGVAILARLLTPNDYGLIAMVTAVTGIGELFRDFGLSSAAIQAKTVSRGQRDNLFWANTAIGLALTIATALSAPLIARIYDEPRLIGVVHILAFGFVLNGMATQFRASLTRSMRFRALAGLDVTSSALALTIAVVLARGGHGAAALVVQQVTVSVVLLVGSALAAGWIPGLPRRDESMRSFFSFGWNLLATQLVTYASSNVDSLVLGVRFGPHVLGLYNRAWQLLMSTLSQLRSPTTTVALPVLSRLRTEPVRFGDFVRRGQLGLTYTLVLGLALVATSADPLCAILLGPSWSAATPLIRLLAMAGAFQTLAYVGYWVYLAMGLTPVLLRYTLVSAVIKIACVLAGSAWGVVGVAAGMALAPALAWPLSLWWLSRHVDLPQRSLVLGALRTLVTFGICGGLGWLAGHALGSTSAWATGAVQVGAFLAVLAALSAVIPVLRRDARDVVGVLRLIH